VAGVDAKVALSSGSFFAEGKQELPNRPAGPRGKQPKDEGGYLPSGGSHCAQPPPIGNVLLDHRGGELLIHDTALRVLNHYVVRHYRA